MKLRKERSELTDIYAFLGQIAVVDLLLCTPPMQLHEARVVRNELESHASSRMVQLIEPILNHVVRPLDTHQALNGIEVVELCVGILR